MKFLVVGDVIGRPGRQVLNQFLPRLRKELGLDMVIVNGENSAGGFGLNLQSAMEMYDAGTDIITSGNHIWAQKEILPHLNGELPILRPLNYPPGVPGRGFIVTEKAIIVNLIGRTFIGDFDCPFRCMDALLDQLPKTPKIIIIDFHAEATSEKQAMGWYLDGRVSAVLGTHTHVGTIDTRVLPHGTAFVSDIGMTGPIDSVIGDDIDLVIQRFLTKMPNRLSVGKGKAVLNAIMVTADETTGRATAIERITRMEQ